MTHPTPLRSTETASRETSVPLFMVLLCEFRECRGMSQAEMGRRAGLTNSYVSRLEGGSRQPARVAAIKLSEALRLSGDEHNELLRAAGYASGDPVDPAMAVVAEALAILADATTPLAVRLRLRSDIAKVVAEARREAA